MTLLRMTAIAALWAANAYGAPTESEIIAATKSYETAVRASDFKQAVIHAGTAYRGAEALWGASRADTAFLAMAYGDALLQTEVHGSEILSSGRQAEAAEVFGRCADILSAYNGWTYEKAYCLFGQTIDGDVSSGFHGAISALERSMRLLEPLVDVDLRAGPLLNLVYWRLMNFEASIPTVMGSVWQRNNHAEYIQSLERAASYARKAREPLESAGMDMLESLAVTYLVEGKYFEKIEDYSHADELYRQAHIAYEKLFGLEDGRTIMAQGEVQRVDVLAIQQAIDAVELKTSKLGSTPQNQDCRFVERVGEEIEVCPRTRASARFPIKALPAFQWGYVLLEYDIGTSGNVKEVRLIKSWPSEIFNKSARNAVKKWLYAPPRTSAGVEVAVDGLQALIRFELSNGRRLDE